MHGTLKAMSLHTFLAIVLTVAVFIHDSRISRVSLVNLGISAVFAAQRRILHCTKESINLDIRHSG